MNPELLAELLGLLERPRGEVMDELDGIAARNPLVADKVGALKGFLGACYQALAGNTVAGIAEAVALFKTGSGPIDPNIGDTA